jgi:hypothetical protein
MRARGLGGVLVVVIVAALLRACVDHPALGWTKSGAALSKTAVAGDRGAYARRVARGCIKGED